MELNSTGKVRSEDLMSKVLIVEDENHIRRLIQVVLEKAGLEVISAESGETALEHIQDGLIPDLVLLDIMMPGIDGLQVLKILQSGQSTKDIPVVMLTALAQENVVLKGVKLGARDYIRKPFHPKELLARIAPFIEEQKESE